MNISKRTFLYSTILAVSISLLLITFMAFLFPRLYVEYREDEIIHNAKEIHKAIVAGEDIEALNFVEPLSSMNVVADINKGQIKLDYIWGRLTLNLSQELNDDVKNIVDKMEAGYSSPSDGLYSTVINADLKEDINELIDKLKADLLFVEAKGKLGQENGEPKGSKGSSITVNSQGKSEYNIKLGSLLELNLSSNEDRLNTIFDNAQGKQKSSRINDNGYCIYESININDNIYGNCLVISKESGTYYFTLVSSILPLMKDTLSVFGLSLPMLLIIITILVAVFSIMLSKQIVKPIEKIANHAKFSFNFTGSVKPLALSRKDEIGELSRTLDDLYEKSRLAYERLEKESERKNIFLRAGSHQLKTPLAAAKLLIDGMRDKLGKYADRDKYLEVLKTEIIKMEVMVENILSMPLEESANSKVELDVKQSCKAILKNYSMEIKSKNLSINLNDGKWVLHSDPKLIENILDNLISNAVRYAENNTSINFSFGGELKISNESSRLNEDERSSVFEPFSSRIGGGSGLGLYLAKYYATILSLELDFQYEAKGKGAIVSLRLAEK